MESNKITSSRKNWENLMKEKYGELSYNSEEAIRNGETARDLHYVVDNEGNKYFLEDYNLEPRNFDCESAEDVYLAKNIIINKMIVNKIEPLLNYELNEKTKKAWIDAVLDEDMCDNFDFEIIGMYTKTGNPINVDMEAPYKLHSSALEEL